MKSGRTYMFRYMVHGDRYHVGPQEAAEHEDSSASARPSANDDDSLGDEPLPPPLDKKLPHGIRFLPADGGGALAALGDTASTQAAESGDNWSDPIYFYSDGSTSDARLLLAADKHTAMRLVLRGVTGTATADDNVTDTESETRHSSKRHAMSSFGRGTVELDSLMQTRRMFRRYLRPEGTFENSAAIYRWVDGRATNDVVPEGRLRLDSAGDFNRPSGTKEACILSAFPAVNCWAILMCPSGQKLGGEQPLVVFNHIAGRPGLFPVAAPGLSRPGPPVPPSPCWR